MSEVKDIIKDYSVDPVRFVREVLKVTPNNHQLQVLSALPHSKRISVRSGNGTGKTAVESWIILWFMFTHPNCRVICTAPTQHQLYDVLWSELAKWFKGNTLLNGLWEITASTLYDKKHPETWFAVARASNEAVNFQGFHEESILFLIDEASGVSDDIWEAIRGSLTTKNAYCLMFGNPNFLEGFYYQTFHKNSEFWTNFHFNCLESSQVHPDFIREIVEDFGEDSNQYRVRVLGEFPLEESTDIYLPLSLVKPAFFDKNLLWEDKPNADYEYDLGLDIARFGEDETVWTISQHNMRYVKHRSIKITHIASVLHKPLTEIAGRTVDLHRKWNFKTIYVDETGLGAGVYDMLKEQGLPVVPITFNKKVDTGRIADTNKEAMYRNLKLLFEKQKKLMQDKQEGLRTDETEIFMLPTHPKLLTQLVSLHFDYSSAGTLMIHHEDGGHDDYPDSLALSLFRYAKGKRSSGVYTIA